MTRRFCSTPCKWDESALACRVFACNDFEKASECVTARCVFEPDIGYCREPEEAVPCSQFFTSDQCLQQPRCSFDSTANVCFPADGHPPCASFSALGAALCPTTFCEFDEAGGLCNEQGIGTPCKFYQTKETCSISGTEFEVASATSTTDAHCRRAAVCTDGEYERLPLLANRDRLCLELEVCTDTQYETFAPTVTSNRRCAELTKCDPGQYISVLPTATSDVLCGNVTQCSFKTGEMGETYEAASATLTSNTVCLPLTICQPDQFEVASATLTSNRGMLNCYSSLA